VEFRLTALAAELPTASPLLAHRAFADDADLSVILLEAAGAAKGVTRSIGFTLELGAAARITTAAPNKSRVDFGGVGAHIHEAFPV
jgi:hypothetical protein